MGTPARLAPEGPHPRITRRTRYRTRIRLARSSAGLVRQYQWRYLHHVVDTERTLKTLVYQLTELYPARYTSDIRMDIRDGFELSAS